jgi:hypothetical protein
LLESYGCFGQIGSVEPKAALAYQLEMINWYHQRGQLVHALSLAREWLVSFLCAHLELDMEDKSNREEMELLLSGGTLKDAKTSQVLKVARYLDRWPTVPAGKRLRRLWGSGYNLANLRNDVLHSGFRKKSKSSIEVRDAVDQALQELNVIVIELGFKPKPTPVKAGQSQGVAP